MRVSRGVTTARSLAARRRSRTVGRTSRANGRSWSRMTGVVSRRNGRVSRSAGASARAPGAALQRRAELGRERRRSCAASSRSARARPAAAAAPRAGCRLLRRRSPRSWRWPSPRAPPARGPWSPSSVASSWKLWTTRVMFRRRSASSRGDPLAVARGRLEALERLAQSCGGGRPVAPRRRLEGLPPAFEQHPQVVARVGVERRQHLVGVDVGQRVGDRDAARPPRSSPAAFVPGSSARYMSLRPVFGRSRIVASLVDRRVLRLIFICDDGAAVLELDAADVADLHAGDVHRLALAGHDRLRGLAARPPARRSRCRPPAPRPAGRSAGWTGCSRRPPSAEHEHEQDRDEVAQVLAIARLTGRPRSGRRSGSGGRCVVAGDVAACRRRLGRAAPGGCRAAARSRWRTAGRRRPTGRCWIGLAAAARSGSACRCRCRRSSATRRRARPALWKNSL